MLGSQLLSIQAKPQTFHLSQVESVDVKKRFDWCQFGFVYLVGGFNPSENKKYLKPPRSYVCFMFLFDVCVCVFIFNCLLMSSWHVLMILGLMMCAVFLHGVVIHDMWWTRNCIRFAESWCWWCLMVFDDFWCLLLNWLGLIVFDDICWYIMWSDHSYEKKNDGMTSVFQRHQHWSSWKLFDKGIRDDMLMIDVCKQPSTNTSWQGKPCHDDKHHHQHDLLQIPPHEAFAHHEKFPSARPASWIMRHRVKAYVEKTYCGTW